MMAVTHASFAILLLYLLGDVSRGSAVFAALGALLPDIDTPKSAVGRALPFISVPLNKRFGHRTVTHTLYAFAFVLAASLPAGKPELALGYASHLLSDMVTKTGVPLLYPRNLYFVFPGSSDSRVEVGGPRERVIASFLLLIASSTAFAPSPKAVMYNLMGSERSAEFQIAGLFEEGKTVEADVRYFDGVEVVRRSFVVVGVEGMREGIVLYDPVQRELVKTKDLRVLRITARESKNYRLRKEELDPWEVFRRDFDVFIITVRFEGGLEGERKYKTRREIEDLGDMVFEGGAVGLRIERM